MSLIADFGTPFTGRESSAASAEEPILFGFARDRVQDDVYWMEDVLPVLVHLYVPMYLFLLFSSWVYTHITLCYIAHTVLPSHRLKLAI